MVFRRNNRIKCIVFYFERCLSTYFRSTHLNRVSNRIYLQTIEFENKTHLVTYSAKRGRHLMKDKLVASLLTTTVITVILLAITLSYIFYCF